MYVAALRGLKREKGEAMNGDAFTLNPCDLIDFMVNRAQVEPLAFCVLVELRFSEVIFLLHECEKQSKNDLFIASMKFLLPLFASSHAIKYVSMVCDFLIDWHCMSDSERIIFAKAVLTRKTKNGSNIFTDRFVEWMMRDMRIWLGKHASLHHHRLVEQVALTLNDRKKQKSEGAKKRGKSQTSDVKEIAIDRVFCHTLIFCSETNLWGPGEIIIEAGESSSSHAAFDQDDGRPRMVRPFTSFKGVPLNTDLLFCISTGLKRSKDYFETNLVLGDWNDPKRSEKESEGGVSLKKIDGTAAADEKDCALNEARVALLDVTEIKKAYTASELKDEFKLLNAELKKKGLPPVKKNNHAYPGAYNKAAYASCIASQRLQMMDLDENWIDKRKEDIWEKNDMRRMAKERDFTQRMKDELKNPFFCLNSTEKYNAFKTSELQQYSFIYKNEQEINNNNDDNGIVFSDGEDNIEENRGSTNPTACQNQDDHTIRQGAAKNSRISFGGTEIFKNLGKMFFG